MTDNNKEKEILFPFDGTNLKMTNGDPSTTPISHFITTLTNDLYTTNHSSGFQHNHEDFNYAMYLAVPVGAVLLVILLIVVVILIRRNMRKRQLRRDLLPHYGYDHSEAEVFDGYTQFHDGPGSIERLSQDMKRTKEMSPNSTDRSLISLEVSSTSNAEEKPNGSSTPNEFINSQAI